MPSFVITKKIVPYIWKQKGCLQTGGMKMTERERRKRRQALQKRIEGRSNKKQEEDGTKGLFLFRLYVTVVLSGAVFLLSFFHTPTSEQVIGCMKKMITYQMPIEHVMEAKQEIQVFLQKNHVNIPAFFRKQEKEKKEFVPEQAEDSP